MAERITRIFEKDRGVYRFDKVPYMATHMCHYCLKPEETNAKMEIGDSYSDQDLENFSKTADEKTMEYAKKHWSKLFHEEKNSSPRSNPKKPSLATDQIIDKSDLQNIQAKADAILKKLKKNVKEIAQFSLTLNDMDDVIFDNDKFSNTFGIMSDMEMYWETRTKFYNLRHNIDFNA